MSEHPPTPSDPHEDPPKAEGAHDAPKPEEGPHEGEEHETGRGTPEEIEAAKRRAEEASREGDGHKTDEHTSDTKGAKGGKTKEKKPSLLERSGVAGGLRGLGKRLAQGVKIVVAWFMVMFSFAATAAKEIDPSMVNPDQVSGEGGGGGGGGGGGHAKKDDHGHH